MNRELKNIIIVDNSPIAYSLNINNGLPIKTWLYDDMLAFILDVADGIHLEKDINDFLPYEGKYTDGYVALILICPKTNHAMWTLYIGNDDNAFNTFAAFIVINS